MRKIGNGNQIIKAKVFADLKDFHKKISAIIKGALFMKALEKPNHDESIDPAEIDRAQKWLAGGYRQDTNDQFQENLRHAIDITVSKPDAITVLDDCFRMSEHNCFNCKYHQCGGECVLETRRMLAQGIAIDLHSPPDNQPLSRTCDKWVDENICEIEAEKFYVEGGKKL